MEKLTSFDNRPSIEALQNVEQQIIQLLEIASQTCKTLGTTENSQQEIITLSSDYLNLIKKIKESLTIQIQRISPELPYQSSMYGSKKDSEISQKKVQHIHQQLKDIMNLLQQQQGLNIDNSMS